MNGSFVTLVETAYFLSSPHLYFIIVFICDLFVSRGELENLHADRTTVCFEPSRGRGWAPVKPV